MKLALRRTAAENATWAQRQFAALTRWRLCSVYCHSGIVIGDTLYHANAAHGLHATSFTPERWDLFEFGGDDDHALRLFYELRGTPYDYLGVLGFGLPVDGDDDLLYCFEWSALARDLPHERWMTPEKLILFALNNYNKN